MVYEMDLGESGRNRQVSFNQRVRHGDFSYFCSSPILWEAINKEAASSHTNPKNWQDIPQRRLIKNPKNQCLNTRFCRSLLGVLGCIFSSCCPQCGKCSVLLPTTRKSALFSIIVCFSALLPKTPIIFPHCTVGALSITRVFRIRFFVSAANYSHLK